MFIDRLLNAIHYTDYWIEYPSARVFWQSALSVIAHRDMLEGNTISSCVARVSKALPTSSSTLWETVAFQAVPWPQRLHCTGCFGHCFEIEERFCILVQQHPLSRTTHKSQTDAQLTPQNKKNDSLQTHQRKTGPHEQGAYYNCLRKSRPENLHNTLDWGKSVVPLAGQRTGSIVMSSDAHMSRVKQAGNSLLSQGLQFSLVSTAFIADRNTIRPSASAYGSFLHLKQFPSMASTGQGLSAAAQPNTEGPLKCVTPPSRPPARVFCREDFQQRLISESNIEPQWNPYLFSNINY